MTTLDSKHLSVSFIVFSAVLIALSFGQKQGFHSDGSLDKKHIHELYFNGDFGKVIEILEEYRSSKPKMAKKDKIFLYKYLGVVYASDSSTAEKGESYMYQLLKLAPDIDLIKDMYISGKIESIFNRVKDRYNRTKGEEPVTGDSAANQGTNQNATAASLKDSSSGAGLTALEEDAEPPGDKGSPPQPEKKKSKHSWIWWTAGGVAVTGAVAAFVLMPEQEKRQPREVGYER